MTAVCPSACASPGARPRCPGPFLAHLAAHLASHLRKLLVHVGLHFLDGPEDLGELRLGALSAVRRRSHSAESGEELTANGDCRRNDMMRMQRSEINLPRLRLSLLENDYPLPSFPLNTLDTTATQVCISASCVQPAHAPGLSVMRMLHLPMRAYFPSNSLCSNNIKYTSLPIYITINAPAQLVAQPRAERAAICTYVNLLGLL